MQFSATLRGLGHPILLHREALTTNETVDYTCHIKHNQLELLLKYSQTCCARKYKRVTGHTSIRAWNPLTFVFWLLRACPLMSFPFCKEMIGGSLKIY